MLPSALVEQLEEGMSDFLRASFWSSTPAFQNLIGDFIGESDQLFQGPFFSLSLPFKVGDGSAALESVPLRFPAYAHQEAAWKRLRNSQNTLVATGTGSGKTECFLVPLLAHCAATAGERGIKAIILYPMNALATDQATRIAKLIHNTPSLRGKVTAGMYVGQREKNPSTTMSATRVITDRDTIRRNPPDILLTNYKMLDYLMIRPDDQKLWADNGPETLSYLIVDELHTFDGAQGTDLACLIRRLKSRLRIEPRHLTCVGTSATLGGDEVAPLVAYASEVFGEPFVERSVVREARQSIGEFLGDAFVRDVEAVSVEHLDALDPASYPDDVEYLLHQIRLWFPGFYAETLQSQSIEDLDRCRLGDELKSHLFFQNLLRALGGEVRSLEYLVYKLKRSNTAYTTAEGRYARLVVLSLLSLVSAALAQIQNTDETMPFMQVRVQLWQREMRRMVADVSERPRLRFSDDLTAEQAQRHLPVIHCRECGSMGWAALIPKDRASNATTPLRSFYQSFFAGDPRVSFIYPIDGGPRVGQKRWLDCKTLNLVNNPDDTHDKIAVIQPIVVINQNGNLRLDRSCPCCSASSSVSLLGFQAATLTSVFISQLFASRFNDDKKLLTFSDSVQDASHRAGFFGARTWNFNTRMAVHQVARAHGSLVPINELSGMVATHWREKAGSEEAYVGLFTPWSLQWHEDYSRLVATGKLRENSRFGELIDRRLTWQVFSEYGHRRNVGRSLRRSGSSAALIEPGLFKNSVGAVSKRLRNEIGGFEKLSDDDVANIVHGFLNRMLDRGAILHSEFPDRYLDTAGQDTYFFGRKWPWLHLPEAGRSSYLPSFVTPIRQGQRFEPLLNRVGSTWYGTWLLRMTENKSLLSLDLAQDAVRTVFDELTEVGVLKYRPGNSPLWGIAPEALVVSTDLVCVECDTTKERFWVGREESDLWDGMPNLNGAFGSGCYRIIDAEEPFFGRLYNRGEVARINAKEHTGLLDRADREFVEERFKTEHQHPWNPNLLSSTPTLEMGIDIGALSSAIMCSVPPAVSNFVQRIGRAGRRDGNSLILTLANARAHDLYFFQNPTEMIEGVVDTPGVFLNASSVLSRQLTAFSLDRWVESGVTNKDFSRKLGTVLNALGTDDPGKFPHNLLTYIETHQTDLLDGFLALFEDSISDETRQTLIHFMQGGGDTEGSLAWRIINGLTFQKRDRLHFENVSKRLRERVKGFEAQKALSDAETTELSDLRREYGAMKGLIRRLNDRDTLNFFTDEGLLPNYAFPEAGVSLKSIIWRKTKRAGDEKENFENIEYSYERPARSAIVELAPNNRFYAGGRYVTISQIDIKGSTIEPWRFCPRCSHAERISESDSRQTCPACGSAHWADVAQRQNMLQLRQVFAWTNDRESRIGDDRDERTPAFYNRQMLVGFPESGEGRAWYVTDESTPFGFEYVSGAVFREINFGDHSEIGSQFQIDGVQSVRSGFEVCTDCGTVQPRTKSKHTSYCKWNKAEDNATYTQVLYLYREFQSEAVRMLLPFVDELGYQRKLHSFVAALEMGLKTYFGGRIDHLQSTIHSEPIEDGLQRKQYLVLYDTVPGGTGYLKELVRDEKALFEVLDVAFERLKNCACQHDPEKDGCYRCLLAYRHSFDMAETSRQAAMDVISQILEHRGDIAEIPSLGKVSVSGLIDSVLEMKFLEAMKRLAKQNDGELSSMLVRGKPGYRLDLPHHTWFIEPQVDIGAADGVVTNVSVDFVIRPQKESNENRPICVFTDGRRFHYDRLARDFEQRMALVSSGRFWTWSLSWDDVEVLFGASGDHAFDILGTRQESETRVVAQHMLGSGPLTEWLDQPSLPLLFSYLNTGQDEYMHRVAVCGGLAPLLSSAAYGESDFDIWRQDLADVARPEVVDFMCEDLGDMMVGGSHRAPEGFKSKYFVVAPPTSISKRSCKDVKALLWLDDVEEQRERDEFSAVWNGVLNTLNILQFLGHIFVVTVDKDEDVDFVSLIEQMTVPEYDALDAEEWNEAISYLQEAYYEPILEALREFGVSAPVAGFELEDERGRAIGAMAEAAWSHSKVALIVARKDEPEYYDSYRTGFIDAGWTVFDMVETGETPERVAEAILSAS